MMIYIIVLINERLFVLELEILWKTEMSLQILDFFKYKGIVPWHQN
jgi:hypothetical protein